MPIKNLLDRVPSKAEYAIGKDVELNYCSESCLLKDIDHRSRIVKTGQTDATALTVIRDSHHLLVPIAGAQRSPAHVLGAQSSVNGARRNWETLIGHGHSALMPVSRVCDCMAEVQILEGEEFEDAATTPAWKRVRGIVGSVYGADSLNQSVGFDQWCRWMSELASGLDELENRGLAHGDPYPFNAIRTGSGASWVDFGHLTDDHSQRLKDVWAFVLFTVLHTLGKAGIYSPALLERLAQVLIDAEKPGAFNAMRQVLSDTYFDVVPSVDSRSPSLVFAEAFAEQSQRASLIPDVSKLLLKSSVQYFSDFLHHIHRGNQYFNGFNFEKQRHHFLEQEMLRLTVPLTENRNQIAGLNQAVVDRDGQIASLNQAVVDRDGQIASLNQAVVDRDGQIVSLNQAVVDRDGQIASLNQAGVDRDGQIVSLNQAVVDRDGQIASLNQAVVERDHQLAHLRDEAHSLFSRLNQLLHSRSWQLTRPLRAAARLVKHGHPFAGSNRAIYDMAARIGRKFPFPLGLKARVRRALLERIYSNDAPVLLRKDAIDQLPCKASEHIDDSRTFMRPECCGLIEGLVSVVLPVYNQANLIEESIESVLNQTHQNFELIIINDGSSDGVEAVLERYLDHPKVRCFTQVNQRLPKALSNGFSFARGEFWTWTSADNIMEPRMLELLVGKLRAEPELGMTYADYYAIDDLGNLLYDRSWRAHNRPNPASGEIRPQRTTEMLNIVQDNFIGPCFMYRGWIGRCMGDYDPQLGVEDYDYWMRINAFFPILHLGDDRLLYRYRVHDNTLSAKAHEHKILEKAQQLMAYEKERAVFYGERLAYVADSVGRAWLQAHGILDAAINSFENDVNVVALAIISSECAENNISELLHSERPLAIIIDRTKTRYHKLSQLFGARSCIVLACDKVSADRVKLVSSTCPVIDANSAITLNSLESFAKNLLFIRSTRTPEELKRELPRPISQIISRHVALQVDSFTQGGMENVVIDLALSLGENGCRVTIANFGKSGDATEKAKERGLKVVSMSDNLSDEAYRSWLIEEGVDLVNAHYSIRGADVCFSAGIPCIQTIHNSYVWLDPVQIEKYRIADQYISQYICVSMTAARYADVVLGLDASKMRVVPNGIDPDAIDIANFEANRTSMRGTWGVEDTAPIYLNVASIMATKAQLPLVRAFAQVVENIPQARLVLLGTVMEAPYQSAIEKAVRELGLQKHVIFSGYDRQVSRHYHAADVFVLPSYWEGWSLSLGEAMTNGLSCVITDVGSAYEFEGFDNVEIIEPPFGDIALLNYKNLGDFVYGEDKAFQNRLTAAMINMARIRKGPVNDILLRQLDRKNAYQKYSEMFSGIINERN